MAMRVGLSTRTTSRSPTILVRSQFMLCCVVSHCTSGLVLYCLVLSCLVLDRIFAPNLQFLHSPIHQFTSSPKTVWPWFPLFVFFVNTISVCNNDWCVCVLWNVCVRVACRTDCAGRMRWLSTCRRWYAQLVAVGFAEEVLQSNSPTRERTRQC